jgi:hypothetical protein
MRVVTGLTRPPRQGSDDTAGLAPTARFPRDEGETAVTADRPSEPRAGATHSGRRVVVAGDTVVNWSLARTRAFATEGTSGNAEDRVETSSGPGGAALLFNLTDELGAALADAGLTVEVSGPTPPRGSVAPGDPRFHHSYATWARFPYRAGERGRAVWRVEEFLGVDRARDAEIPAVDPVGTVGQEHADLVILDDANLDFRDHPERWPVALRAAADATRSPWVVLTIASPVAEGALWRHLLGTFARRLVVVMTLGDLRRSDVKISRELSWERTAADLARELVRHPTVNGLTRCAHVVVTVGTGGAVLLSRPAAGGPAENTPECRVVFDPEAIENSWAEQVPGAMIGDTTCLVAGIARELLIAPEAPDIDRGLRRGLAAGRALHLTGYAATDTGTGLAFPFTEVAKQLGTDTTGFATARIAQPARASWSILESRYPEGLEPVAEAVARDGVERALAGVPLGRFGKLLTVDRGEIEGFRSIRALMREYDAEPASRPLNIAVFGPPGAGKSFGVKAVAKSSISGGRVEDLTFNLSQMTDPADIVDALHQVRDAGLRGKLPFVLWDEFDSDLAGRPFGWLRHFLAPMQDGAFQQGQILHPVGKSIFVFAGGTSARLADFAGEQSAEFRLAKGPDFVSRLKGHVDIVGPDPRGGDREADPHFRIRRAILLRSMLLRDRPGLSAAGRLQVDPGVLRAFLEVPTYRHGARSMESIVAMSTLHGASRFERSALPAPDQLDAHVDATQFMELVERYVPAGELLDRLAEAIHAGYCEEMLTTGHAWAGTAAYLAGRPSLAAFADRPPVGATLPALVDWADLPEHLKEMNRDAARNLPDKLAALGYVLCQDPPAEGSALCIDPDDPRVERLAKREHERWLRREVKTGWRYGERRDDARRLHPSIRPWKELSEGERRKDRLSIGELPKVVAAAGMGVVPLGEQGEVTVGISGHRILAEVKDVAAGIEKAFARIAEAFPGRPVTVISELAEGADRLAVEQALHRPGTRLVAVLPVPTSDYLADFESAGSRNQFLALLDSADEVVELPACPDRDSAYAAANDEVLDRAQVLLVIWDGQGAQGRGGTGEVVARARTRGLPIAWVHAGNRRPGSMQPTSLGTQQGAVSYERL